jgi:hypothetical protein
MSSHDGNSSVKTYTIKGTRKGEMMTALDASSFRVETPRASARAETLTFKAHELVARGPQLMPIGLPAPDGVKVEELVQKPDGPNEETFRETRVGEIIRPTFGAEDIPPPSDHRIQDIPEPNLPESIIGKLMPMGLPPPDGVKWEYIKPYPTEETLSEDPYLPVARGTKLETIPEPNLGRLDADFDRSGGVYMEDMKEPTGPHIQTCGLRRDPRMTPICPVEDRVEYASVGGARMAMETMREPVADGKVFFDMRPAANSETIPSPEESLLRKALGKAKGVRRHWDPAGRETTGESATQEGHGPRLESMGEVPEVLLAKPFKIETPRLPTPEEAEKLGYRIESMGQPYRLWKRDEKGVWVEELTEREHDVGWVKGVKIERMKEPSEEEAKAKGFKIENMTELTPEVAAAKGLKFDTIPSTAQATLEGPMGASGKLNAGSKSRLVAASTLTDNYDFQEVKKVQVVGGIKVAMAGSGLQIPADAGISYMHRLKRGSIIVILTWEDKTKSPPENSIYYKEYDFDMNPIKMAPEKDGRQWKWIATKFSADQATEVIDDTLYIVEMVGAWDKDADPKVWKKKTKEWSNKFGRPVGSPTHDAAKKGVPGSFDDWDLVFGWKLSAYDLSVSGVCTCIDTIEIPVVAAMREKDNKASPWEDEIGGPTIHVLDGGQKIVVTGEYNTQPKIMDPSVKKGTHHHFFRLVTNASNEQQFEYASPNMAILWTESSDSTPHDGFVTPAGAKHSFIYRNDTEEHVPELSILSPQDRYGGYSCYYLLGSQYAWPAGKREIPSVVVIKVDLGWKPVAFANGEKAISLADKATFPIGACWDASNKVFYVAYNDVRNTVETGSAFGNIRIAAFNSDWALMADEAVTAYDYPETADPDDLVQAGNPWILKYSDLQGNYRLAVSYAEFKLLPSYYTGRPKILYGPDNKPSAGWVRVYYPWQFVA